MQGLGGENTKGEVEALANLQTKKKTSCKHHLLKRRSKINAGLKQRQKVQWQCGGVEIELGEFTRDYGASRLCAEGVPRGKEKKAPTFQRAQRLRHEVSSVFVKQQTFPHVHEVEKNPRCLSGSFGHCDDT